ncbi:MAG: hypothetical protein MI921_12030 [Cytophagales bacterium]|nr:hypothetical protein [Cytophagales bacterium]
MKNQNNLLEKALNILFKRNYFDRSIYLAVGFLISSIIALSSKNSWLLFFDEQITSYQNNEWAILLLNIAKTILLGGSWTVTIASALLVIALLTIRYKVSKGSISGEQFYDEEFKFCQEEIEGFYFKAAFRRLQRIKTEIDRSSLLKLSKPLLAKLHFLLGEASNWIIGQEDEKWNYYVRAYNYEKSNLKYKERYCTTLLHRKDNRALPIANEILHDNESSGRAWSVKLLKDERCEYEKLPHSIKNNIDFILIYGQYLYKSGKSEKINNFMQNEIAKIKYGDISIGYRNIFYYNLIAGFSMEIIL